jgi:hypothetical protein
MRYLINMDYSSDLPINSMGRRVRSRLYFTSESHLHSLLNVLRISSFKEGCVKSPLSNQGQNILADASELCYLTQVVIRLFEDTQKSIEDPKRFRVEIWFSPGATATPMHMEAMYRENDASRFDTEKLQKISIEGLTCTQVEAYFAEAMKDGKIKPSLDDISEDLSKLKGGKEKKKDKKEKDKATPVEEPTDVKDVAAPNMENNDAEASISATNSNGQTPVEEEKSIINDAEHSELVCEKSSKSCHIESTDTTRSSVIYFGVALGAAAIALLLSRGRGKR